MRHWLHWTPDGEQDPLALRDAGLRTASASGVYIYGIFYTSFIGGALYVLCSTYASTRLGLVLTFRYSTYNLPPAAVLACISVSIPEVVKEWPSG